MYTQLLWFIIYQDSDVTAEREKVKNGEITDEHIVVIRNLTKVR